MKHTAFLAISAALLLVSSSVSALGTNYEHDAKTTYCWAIPRRTNETKLTESDRTPAFAGTENCPLTVTLSLSSDQIHAFDAVGVKWTVTADFSSANAINNTKIYFGKDSNNKSAQIVHSNIHSCVFGTGCDPFNDGKELVDKTVNRPANFTDSAAEFSDTIQFPTPGEYSLLAHIILPNFNASSRFDYAVYAKVVVMAATTAPQTTAPVVVTPTPEPVVTSASPSTSTGGGDDGGLSQEATIGIVVGCIVLVVALIVVAIIIKRRNTKYMPAPITATTMDTSANNRHSEPKNHQSNITMTNSTTGFESAWGGEQRLSNTGLDRSNQSNASSSNTYTAPRPSDRTFEMGGAFSNAIQQQDMGGSTSTYSTAGGGGGRKKRVDSDVEL